MVSGVFGMFFIHRKRTASPRLSEKVPLLFCCFARRTALFSQLKYDRVPGTSVTGIHNFRLLENGGMKMKKSERAKKR